MVLFRALINVDDCHRNEVREARRGDPARLLRRSASRNGRPNIKGDCSKKPKPLTADYADYADKSSYPNGPAGLEPTTTLGIRFIRAIRDGFIPRLNNVDDCHRNEVREARRGDPARLLRRFASRNDSPKITGDWCKLRGW